MPQTGAIAAFVEAYSACVGKKYSVTRVPDEINRTTKQIDAFAEAPDGPPLAIEHTLIQTIGDQKLNNARFEKYFLPVANRLAEVLPRDLEIILRGSLELGQDWTAIVSALEAWVLANARRFPKGFSGYDDIEGVPFTVSVLNTDGTDLPFQFSRFAPEDSIRQTETASIMREALECKHDQMAAYAGTDAQMLLLLESADWVLTNSIDLHEAYLEARAAVDAPDIDQVWLARFFRQSEPYGIYCFDGPQEIMDCVNPVRLGWMSRGGSRSVNELTERAHFEFLCRLYELADGDCAQVFEALSIGKELGFSPEDTNRVVEELEGDLEPVEYGATGWTVKITDYGLEEVEGALIAPGQEMESFPAACAMYADQTASPRLEDGTRRDRRTAVGSPRMSSAFARLAEKFLSGELKLRAYTQGEEPGTLEDILASSRQPDYTDYGYKCQDRITIGGAVLKGRNVVVVNDTAISTGDAGLLLLLRLVLELKKGQGGWVNRHTLASEGIVANGEGFQPYSRLRHLLRGSLPAPTGGELIENDGRKSYRLSTHPDFVAYDKKKLLGHPNGRVRDLARALP